MESLGTDSRGMQRATGNGPGTTRAPDFSKTAILSFVCASGLLLPFALNFTGIIPTLPHPGLMLILGVVGLASGILGVTRTGKGRLRGRALAVAGLVMVGLAAGAFVLLLMWVRLMREIM